MKWPWRRETRAQVVTQRDLALVEWLAGDQQRFGQQVNAVRAEWLSAVTAAIDAIAGTIASLPAYVYRVTDAGREEDEAHPLALIVRDGFNENLTWPDGMQWLAAECLRHGNAVAEKIADDGARIRELRPLPWPSLAAKVLPTGRMVYDFTDPLTGRRRRLLDTEVLHLRDRTDDGLIGRARHERAHPVIAAALALSEFSGNNFANGCYPSGVLQADGKLGDTQLTRLQAMFKELFAGPTKAGKALVLDQGIKWESVTATPEDIELLAARRFAIEEAARLYQVPPPIIGSLEFGTFTNAETLLRWFGQSTISTWCRKIEAEFHRSLFPTASRRTHRFEVDLSGLLRGDPETRWRSHEIAVRNRILTPNEVREVEGWNPREGGDDFEPAPASEATP